MMAWVRTGVRWSGSHIPSICWIFWSELDANTAGSPCGTHPNNRCSLSLFLSLSFYISLTVGLSPTQACDCQPYNKRHNK